MTKAPNRVESISGLTLPEGRGPPAIMSGNQDNRKEAE